MYLIKPIRDGKEVKDLKLLHAMISYIETDLRQLDELTFIPLFVGPHVEIGKNQNPYEEVNETYMEAHHIPLVRRFTGGGAIYYDEGCLAMWFVDNAGDHFGDFDRLFNPVIEVLKELGVKNIDSSGKNDMYIDGKKISGGAMVQREGRIHGGFSLLLDVDYQALAQVLTPNRKKLASKGIKSVKARVGDIRSKLDPKYQTITMEEFRELIIKRLYKVNSVDEAKQYQLTNKDWERIDQIYNDHYGDWEWNYGRTPNFEYTRDEHYPIGTVGVGLSIHKSYIKESKVYGDFIGRGEVVDIEKVLNGTRFDRPSLSVALDTIDFNYYFGNFTKEDFIDLIMS